MTNTYSRNGLLEEHQKKDTKELKMNAQKNKAIRVDGFKQVLDMLKYADDEFRESLLLRLGKQDPELAKNLRAKLD